MQYAPSTRITDDTTSRIEAIAGNGVEFSRAPLKRLGDHDVEIIPQFSFISAGTELNTIRHRLRQVPGGALPAPLGYSQSGIVSRAGRLVEGLNPGDRVVAIGAGAYHANKTVVAKNLVLPLPDAVSPEVASMMAMFCFALEGVYKAASRIGDNVAVLGAGMMGQITARLFHLCGCRVAVLDSNAARLALLPEGIGGHLINAAGWEQLADSTRPYGIEIVSVCFGGDATESIERIKPLMSRSPDGVPHGRIIFPGGARLTVTMASNMGNIQLISSAKAGPGYRDPIYEAGGNYPSAYVSRTVRRNVETLLSLIGNKQLSDLDRLITHRFPFSEAQKAYDLLETPGTTALGVLLDYRQRG
jgi:threonine dehydrogenase-like Zn-dependent dehydrogenase